MGCRLCFPNLFAQALRHLFTQSLRVDPVTVAWRVRYSDCMEKLDAHQANPARPHAATGYAAASGAVVLCTLAGFAMTPRFDIVNIAMVYLLAVVVIALRFSRGAGIFSAVLCVATFDFMFVPPAGVFTINDIQYLLTFAIMLAVALVISSLTERNRREADARAALVIDAETERVRNTLLASISHDLRTPLAVLTGASSSLVEEDGKLAPEQRRALANSIYQQARDMSELVAKVLQMTRLEAGYIELRRDWSSVAEIAGSVLARLNGRLAAHIVMVDIAPDLPLLRVGVDHHTDR